MKPRVLEGAGHVRASSLPRGPNGRALCRYCGEECPPGNGRTFCSGARARFARGGIVLEPGSGCVHEHCVRSQPGYARKLVWARDLGKCALCPAVCGRAGASWQADHVVPVAEGGGSCGLDGLRTLCTACHKAETRALAGRLARARRALVVEIPDVVSDLASDPEAIGRNARRLAEKLLVAPRRRA
jgi:5-methylcytosine-specific restriction endonuclease McrA